MNQFFSHLWLGYKSYFKSLQYVFNKQIAIYFIIPVILNIILLFVGFSFMHELIEYLVSLIKSQIDFDQKSFWGHGYLNDIVNYFLSAVLYILFFLLFIFYGGFIILMLMSPIFSKVSEKTEFLINKKDYKISFSQTIKDVIRSLILTVRNLLLETLITIVLLILGFIPVLNWFVPFAMFLFSSYFFGFAFMDFTNERHKRNVIVSTRYILKHKGLAISLGSVYALSLMIPFCGLSLAAFTTIFSVSAATYAMLEIDKKNIQEK